VLVPDCTHGFINRVGEEFFCTVAVSAWCAIQHFLFTGLFNSQRQLKRSGIEAAIKRRLMSSLRIFLNIYMKYCFVAATLVMQNVFFFSTHNQ
jgi:hypothetical protein